VGKSDDDNHFTQYRRQLVKLKPAEKDMKAWLIKWLICLMNSVRSQCYHLPDGLIAQLVEHCTGMVEFMGLNFSFQASISQLLKLCVPSMINHVFISFSVIQIYDFVYIHLHEKCLVIRTTMLINWIANLWHPYWLFPWKLCWLMSFMS